MKRRCTFKFLFLAVLIYSLMHVQGCSNSNNNRAGSGSESNGSILVMGSTALQPLAEQAARQFIDKNPNTSIHVQGGGSGNGLTAVSQGIADIGNSDIFAEEKSSIDPNGLEDHKVCVVGFAVIANPHVGVDNLSKQQLIDIFTGRIVNWKDVGGSDVGVVLISRPAASGTRAAFGKYALNGLEEASGKNLTQDSSGAVLRTVADTDGAVSYIGLSYIKNNSSIKSLKLDGFDPNADNILNGSYPIWSYEHMYTNGPAQGLTKAFIDFISGNEVKPIIEKLGYIPISSMKITR
jgi:phosphate transport system substrate-binding protein